jgi:hypothetical protein
MTDTKLNATSCCDDECCGGLGGGLGCCGDEGCCGGPGGGLG